MTAPTPDWLLAPETRFGACSCCGKRTKGDAVEKTIAGAGRALRTAMFSADSAAQDGVLQRADPRAKVVTAAVLLLVTALAHHLSVLVGLYALTLLLAVVSKVPLRVVVGRVWCFVPLFTAVVVLPATLSIVTHGRIVVPLGTWFGTRVGLTAQGLTAAAFIVLRVAASISFVLLLTLTTTWPRLLAALERLRVPRTFVLVLGLAYRYLFHLLNTITEMYEARRARAPRDRNVARGRAFVAASAGATFAKAHALSEEVYLAMLARGYTGHVATLERTRLRATDIALLLAVAASALLTIGVDHVVAH